MSTLPALASAFVPEKKVENKPAHGGEYCFQVDEFCTHLVDGAVQSAFGDADGRSDKNFASSTDLVSLPHEKHLQLHRVLVQLKCNIVIAHDIS